MESYPGVDDFHRNVYTLEGFEMFGSTKCKLGHAAWLQLLFPLSKHVHYSSFHPNTKSIRAHLEKLLTSIDHVVVHATNVIDYICPTFQWQIEQLHPNKPNGCWAMQVSACILYNVKVGKENHDISTPT
jgi:hypothetical protein